MRGMRLLAPALLLTVAAPAAADWLVTTSGERLETRGAWELRGAQVVFRTAEGRLASIRTTEIDLPASRELTESPSVAVPASEPVAARPAALVLTDADVGHVSSIRSPELATQEEDTPDSAAEPVAAGAQVEILDWQERVDVEQNVLLVTGQVGNRGSVLVTDTRLEVRLIDSEGRLSESRLATIGQPILRPGERAEFTAVFDGSPGFATIDFDLKSRGFRVQPTNNPN